MTYRSLIVAGAALTLAGCGSGSTTPGRPFSTPSPSVSAPVTGSGRGVLQLTLGALSTDVTYAHFVRPGNGPLLGYIPATSVPTCDPVRHLGTLALPNQTGSQTTVTIAVYPAGDSACAQSPLRALVITYTNGSSPQTALGYEIEWAPANDPVAPPGAVSGLAVVDASIANASDGSLNASVRFDQRGYGDVPSGFPAPPTQPLPGVFPATFPSGLGAPVVPAGYSPSYYIALAESGTTSTTATATDYDSFTTSAQNAGSLATLDGPTVSASASGGGGSLSLSTAAGLPRYFYDASGLSVQIIVPQASFPIPSGTTAWPIAGLAATSFSSGAQNFPSASTGTATYTSDGRLKTCSHTYADAVNKVQATATCASDGTIHITLKDQIAGKALTSPATIVLDAAGSSQPFTFVFDQSTDSIVHFRDANTGG